MECKTNFPRKLLGFCDITNASSISRSRTSLAEFPLRRQLIYKDVNNNLPLQRLQGFLLPHQTSFIRPNLSRRLVHENAADGWLPAFVILGVNIKPHASYILHQWTDALEIVSAIWLNHCWSHSFFHVHVQKNSNLLWSLNCLRAHFIICEVLEWKTDLNKSRKPPWNLAAALNGVRQL